MDNMGIIVLLMVDAGGQQILPNESVVVGFSQLPSDSPEFSARPGAEWTARGQSYLPATVHQRSPRSEIQTLDQRSKIRHQKSQNWRSQIQKQRSKIRMISTVTIAHTTFSSSFFHFFSRPPSPRSSLSFSHQYSRCLINIGLS